MTENNPYQTPAEPGAIPEKQKSGAGRAIYVHSVAMIGALLIFAGGFLAVFVIPTMLSNELASSRQWVTLLLALGVIFGLVCAVLSYRATLKAYGGKAG